VNVNRAVLRLATCGLYSRRRELPRVCFLAVSAGILKVRPETKAPKKFSDIYILHFYIVVKVFKNFIQLTHLEYCMTWPEVEIQDSGLQTGTY